MLIRSLFLLVPDSHRSNFSDYAPQHIHFYGDGAADAVVDGVEFTGKFLSHVVQASQVIAVHVGSVSVFAWHSLDLVTTWTNSKGEAIIRAALCLP